jgi:hypothetical protein
MLYPSRFVFTILINPVLLYFLPTNIPEDPNIIGPELPGACIDAGVFYVSQVRRDYPSYRKYAPGYRKAIGF